VYVPNYRPIAVIVVSSFERFVYKHATNVPPLQQEDINMLGFWYSQTVNVPLIHHVEKDSGVRTASYVQTALTRIKATRPRSRSLAST
jgi:hypothetical protein